MPSFAPSSSRHLHLRLPAPIFLSLHPLPSFLLLLPCLPPAHTGASPGPSSASGPLPASLFSLCSPGKLRGQPGRRLAFRLCLALGWPHPDCLLDALTPEQFAEWADYYNLEPWGFEVEDLRVGILASTIARAPQRS